MAAEPITELLSDIDLVDSAAQAIWYDAYASLVEEDRETEEALAPGPGGNWEDVLPPVPEAAVAQAEEVISRIRVTPEQAAQMREHVPHDLIGYYLAMQSLGHGVSVADYRGVDYFRLPHTGASAEVHNAAYDAVREAMGEDWEPSGEDED